MTVLFDAASNSGEQLSVSSVTLAHTCAGGLGSGLVIAVFSPTRDTAQPITSVTYAGVPVPSGDTVYQNNFASALAVNYFVQLFYIPNPTPGTNNIVVTFAGVSSGIVGGISYTGCGGIANNYSNVDPFGGGDTDPVTQVPVYRPGGIVLMLLGTSPTGTITDDQTNRINVNGTLGEMVVSEKIVTATPNDPETLTFHGTSNNPLSGIWGSIGIQLFDLTTNPFKVMGI